MNIIKESFDNLPMALCFFNRRGIACLVNRRMLWVSTQLLGSSVQTLSELEQALESPPDTVAQLSTQPPTYRFPDGSILRFTQEVIQDAEGDQYTQVTASDVTELVQKQYALAAENQRLEDANQRLRQLMERMPEIVREEEILTMKMQIHDDIGHSILSARCALLQESDLHTIQENAAVWEKSISLLQRANRMPQPDDALEYAISRGKALGVQVVLEGTLPTAVQNRQLLALALSECVTNCVRHAGGSELYVRLRCAGNTLTVTITNNGAIPEETIREGGGLSALRRKIAAAGGRMTVYSRPRFALVVMLPSKEDNQ